MLRHLTQKFIRTVALKLSEHVAKDELFEQVGERKASEPLDLGQKNEGRALQAGNTERTRSRINEQLFFLESAQNLKSTMYTESRFTIVHQWATWCEGCVSELAVVNDLALMLEEQVSFIALSWDLFQHGDRDRAKKDLQAAYDEHQLSFRTAIIEDDPDVFFETFNISLQQVPQTWICSADGTVLFRCEEELTIPKIEELLTTLESLKEQA